MQKLIAHNHYKVIKVEFPAGENMPRHIATSDAFLIVESGSALLIYRHETYELKRGDNFWIAANEQHLLRPIEDFSGYLVLSYDAKIEYDQRN